MIRAVPSNAPPMPDSIMVISPPRGRRCALVAAVCASIVGCGDSRPEPPKSWDTAGASAAAPAKPASTRRKTAKEEDAVLSGKEKRDLQRGKPSG